MSSITGASAFTEVATPDWRSSPLAAETVVRTGIIGRFRFARRCIDAPAIDLLPVENAQRYEILVASLDASSPVFSVRSSESLIDLSAVWNRLPIGRLQLLPRALDADDRLIAVGSLAVLVKSPDWNGEAQTALDYRSAGLGVVDYLMRKAPSSPGHPDDPAYMWHAAVREYGTEIAHEHQFPALSYLAFIALFVTASKQDGGASDPALIARACRLADFLIDHPVTTSGPLAGAPLTTMDQQGGGGMFETDRITLVRIGWLGCSIVSLWESTGDERYLAYAKRLGQILLGTQQADGSWPYRVRISDGDVLESYTAAAIMALLLLERLEALEPHGPWRASFERGLAWTLDNPVKTGLWQQMYEDVPTKEPFENLEQLGALETAMLLLRRKHPDAVAIATKLVRFVEDQFVVFGDDPVFPVPYLPYAPAVMEQYVCYWPMDVHTSNYVRATLALFQATGNRDWGRKAVTAANTVVRCQGPDGRFSTIVPDRRFGVTPPFTQWFNCMAHAAEVLLRHGPELEAISQEEVSRSNG